MASEVTANPGCIIQVLQGLRAQGAPVEVLHIVELLDQAYAAAGTSPSLRSRGEGSSHPLRSRGEEQGEE
jgi:hypothetical protein